LRLGTEFIVGLEIANVFSLNKNGFTGQELKKIHVNGILYQVFYFASELDDHVLKNFV